MIAVFLYNIAIRCYVAGIRIFSIFNAKARLFLKGRVGLLKKIEESFRDDKREKIWVHCASLGEFEQGRPIIEALKAKYPQIAIVLTFFSPSGYEVRKDYKVADYVFYLPVDSAKNARFFLEKVNPKLCIFVKYELWYHYLSGLKHKSVPTFLVSAVFSARHGFFKWYGGLQRSMLRCFTEILVQDEHSATLLADIGIKNVAISGDTRFDRVVAGAAEHVLLPIAEAFTNNYKVVVAGSTWKEDEEMLASVLCLLPEDWRLIVVPHEVDGSHIDAVAKLFAGESINWSEWKENSRQRVLVVDKVGFLSQLYRFATVAFIGGGYGKAGVHNVLEAAVYGKPCFYGPVYHQFIEATELVANKGATVVNNAEEFANGIQQLEAQDQYNNQAQIARNYVLQKTGATAKTLAVIKKYL